MTEPTGPETQPTITDFVVVVDAMEIEEVIGAFIIPVGGGKLPVARAYRGIRYVLQTLHGGLDGAAAVTVKIDSFAADGPVVHAEAADGVSVRAIATFRVGGY